MKYTLTQIQYSFQLSLEDILKGKNASQVWYTPLYFIPVLGKWKQED